MHQMLVSVWKGCLADLTENVSVQQIVNHLNLCNMRQTKVLTNPVQYAAKEGLDEFNHFGKKQYKVISGRMNMTCLNMSCQSTLSMLSITMT